ncbi:unnamed protein product [Gongylonema pulchrum]|uniref:Orotate phosphoribosyltransferase n=1 Tax=Gongylonema pulchrum TaxID=637853 RepID=A0A183DD38_9BILA|nr:unnamed protein product [Gongylonema pulchrum]
MTVTLLADLKDKYELRGCEDVYRRYLDFMPEMIFYPWLEIGRICEVS